MKLRSRHSCGAPCPRALPESRISGKLLKRRPCCRPVELIGGVVWELAAMNHLHEDHGLQTPPAMDSMPGMDDDHLHMGHGAHGSFGGHVLPGTFFLIWSTWWALNVFAHYIVRRNSRKGFKSRTWFLWKWCLVETFEPVCIIILTLIGMLCELRLVHKSWRVLLDKHGHFIAKQSNNWQHSMMYGSFMVSGIVDLLGHYTKHLPAGTEQGFLGLAFLVEGVLMAFHLKGPDLEFNLHLLLVLIIFGCSVVSFLELAWQHSFLLSITRVALVFFQGSWFIQAAHILYLGDPAWDVHDPSAAMGGVMFLPVVFCFHMLLIAICFLTVYVLMAMWYSSAAPARALPTTGLPKHRNTVESGDESSDEKSGRELQVLVAKEYAD